MELFNPFTLSGKTILITGASSGIGKAIAVSCSKMGAKIMLNGRNMDRLESTLSELAFNNHKIFQGDLTLSEDLTRITEGVPSLDGIVYCSGIGQRKPCKMLVPSDVDEVINANFKSSVLLQAELLSKKKVNKSASIVFIGSRAASSPSIGNAVYSASKGAILSYAKCLALELAPQKIRVNCICPAMVWTDLIYEGGLTEEVLLEAQKKYPLKRFGNPEDIANLAIYLLSDASSWMTGSDIDITGGGEGTLKM